MESDAVRVGATLAHNPAGSPELWMYVEITLFYHIARHFQLLSWMSFLSHDFSAMES